MPPSKLYRTSSFKQVACLILWVSHNKSGILIPFCLQSQNSASYQNVNYFYQYPFIYSSYYPKEEKKRNYTKYLQVHCEKHKEKKIFFLHSKRREYQATGTQGQNSSIFFPTLREKNISYRILSYFLQLKHWLSSQNDQKKSIIDFPCTKVLKDFSSV